MHKWHLKSWLYEHMPPSWYKFAFPSFIQTIPGGPSTTCNINSLCADGCITVLWFCLLIPCQLSVFLSSCQPSFVMSVSNTYSFEQECCWIFFWGSKRRWWLLVGLFFAFLFCVHLWTYNWWLWCAWLSFQYLSVLRKSAILPTKSAKNINLRFSNLSFTKFYVILSITSSLWKKWLWQNFSYSKRRLLTHVYTQRLISATLFAGIWLPVWTDDRDTGVLGQFHAFWVVFLFDVPF